MFVTPELAGWTTVVGSWCAPSAAEREVTVPGGVRAPQRPVRAFPGVLVRSAERRLGRPGRRTRRDPAPLRLHPGRRHTTPETRGPLAYEQERRAVLGLPALTAEHLDVDEDDDEWMWELLEMATKLAGELSIDPLSIDAGTPTRGVGLLALTEYGRRLGAPCGALRM